MTKTLFLVAAERSGDDLGAGLIQQLQALEADMSIEAIGGPAMQRLGITHDFDISALSILGFVEGIKAYPLVIAKVQEASQLILDRQPDAVILIDSWGFMVRVAKTLKKRGYKGQIIKYVAPQVWAMRPGRSKVLARWVDHVLSIHKQDAPYFERHRLPVTFVGNPMFDEDLSGGDGQALRKRLNIAADAPLVSVFFGSRPSEIERLSTVLAEAVDYIAQSRVNVEFITPISENVKGQVETVILNNQRLARLKMVDEDQKRHVFAASDVALACSGTVTTQLASQGIPTIVTYKLSPVTFFVARYLFKPKYISLVNMSAGEALMPEFVQHQATGKALGQAVLTFLDDKTLRQTVSQKLRQETEIMKGQGGLAAHRAARTIITLMNSA